MRVPLTVCVGGAGLFQEKPHSLQNSVRTSLEKKKRGPGASWASRPEAAAQGERGGVHRLFMEGRSHLSSRSHGNMTCVLGPFKGQCMETS